MSIGKGEFIMYYATFKNIGETDIVVFQTEQERDDWVNYQDECSIVLGANAENCTFERVAMDSEEAEQRIENMLHDGDYLNVGQEWYYVK